MKKSATRGSLTVEASIFLILFISAYITVFDAVSYINAQTAVQHAANQCARQISEYAYIFTKTGLNGEMKKTQDETKKIESDWKDALGGFQELQGAMSSYANNPSSLQNDIFTVLHGRAENFALQAVSQMVYRQMVNKNLENLGGSDYLEELGVENGLNGLDFKGSGYLVGGEARLDVVVSFQVKRRKIFFEIPNYKVQVRASTGLW